MTVAAEVILTRAKVKKAIAALNEIMGTFSSESAVVGLTGLAVACAVLLDNYSQPNDENPEGMCDDPQAFRRWFTNIIETSPQPAPKKAGAR